MTVQPGLVTHDPSRLIGTFRRFGPVGPVYKVLGVIGPLSSKRHRDDIAMEVEIVETGERVQYSYWDLLDDPLER